MKSGEFEKGTNKGVKEIIDVEAMFKQDSWMHKLILCPGCGMQISLSDADAKTINEVDRRVLIELGETIHAVIHDFNIAVLRVYGDADPRIIKMNEEMVEIKKRYTRGSLKMLDGGKPKGDKK